MIVFKTVKANLWKSDRPVLTVSVFQKEDATCLWKISLYNLSFETFLKHVLLFEETFELKLIDFKKFPSDDQLLAIASNLQ